MTKWVEAQLEKGYQARQDSEVGHSNRVKVVGPIRTFPELGPTAARIFGSNFGYPIFALGRLKILDRRILVSMFVISLCLSQPGLSSLV